MPVIYETIRSVKDPNASLALRRMTYLVTSGTHIVKYRIEYGFNAGYEKGEEGPWEKASITFEGSEAAERLAEDAFARLAEDNGWQHLPIDEKSPRNRQAPGASH